jgi:sugar lactone lactonase YvrE
MIADENVSKNLFLSSARMSGGKLQIRHYNGPLQHQNIMPATPEINICAIRKHIPK